MAGYLIQGKSEVAAILRLRERATEDTRFIDLQAPQKVSVAVLVLSPFAVFYQIIILLASSFGGWVKPSAYGWADRKIMFPLILRSLRKQAKILNNGDIAYLGAITDWLPSPTRKRWLDPMRANLLLYLIDRVLPQKDFFLFAYLPDELPAGVAIPSELMEPGRLTPVSAERLENPAFPMRTFMQQRIKVRELNANIRHIEHEAREKRRKKRVQRKSKKRH